MQFVRRGPDMPERLLQLHEEGRVVFFCGAGISYPARLPGFKELVTKLYAGLSVTPDPVQAAAIKAWQFDTAVGLLEASVMGGRETVRREMDKILKPDLSAPNATATHEALLTLSQTRKGRMRLITTNFDRLFELVITSQSLKLPAYRAPLLPVPKARWDGLVYLHGLLSEAPTAAELDSLVISSGDFGLAYLTERWAARFVSELFRGYTVCFVGYSINDPVLRYMMDALAADRLLGESPPEMFAFGSYSTPKEEDRVQNEWKAKNVTPILYRERKDHDHGYLHDTLRAWAATYRDGVRGKERIVAECAIGRPLGSTKQDNFVGRMLWALSDTGGLPAKHFADFDPVPSLDWLEPLSATLYRHADLGRFGVPAHADVDKELEFSMTHRPAPYTRSGWMALSYSGNGASSWDPPMHNIARWLVRHLDDPTLPLWLVKRGGRLHRQFSWLVEQRLNEIATLEREGKTAELARIRRSAPCAVPRPSMRVLWRLLLNNRVRASSHRFDIYTWRDQFRRDGLTASVRLSLRDALTPCVSLREPFRWPDETKKSNRFERINAIVDWEIELTSDHVHSAIVTLSEEPRWAVALPDLLLDFDVLLHDALDLMRELGGADGRSDRSYVHQPSISKHPQNRNFHDWTTLIDLCRDAWVETSKISPERARATAESWASASHPVFRRLSFFAATHFDVVSPGKGLLYLLQDDGWWLWSVETQREAMRLLVALGGAVSKDELAQLERAILLGPPAELFKSRVEDEQLRRLSARNVWLRLQKLSSSGALLGEPALQSLEKLSNDNPSWKLQDDERDEFPFWMDSGWSGDRDPWRAFSGIPRSRRGVLDYLIAHSTLGPNEQDNWRERCSDSFQATSYALMKLGERGIWPADRWRDALQAWSEEKLRETSWNFMASFVASVPDELLLTVSHGAAWWLQQNAKIFDRHENAFLTLIQRIIHLPFAASDDPDDPVFRAINHPIGQVTAALLDWWYRQDLEDNQNLPATLLPLFTELCNTENSSFIHGRVLLATHSITIFRVDPDWSTKYLLPLFDWARSENEARAAWEGYLWSPRLYRPMMVILKPFFLATAKHFARLGDHQDQFVSLLALAALEPGDTFKPQELATAVRALPSRALVALSDSLVRALEGTGEQREEYWRNRVTPFWKTIWPKAREKSQGFDSSALARLCIAAGSEFPAALALVQNWLGPVEHPDYAVRQLYEEGLCTSFPEDALLLLDFILSPNAAWLPPELRQALNAITQAAPHLAGSLRYQRVDELARGKGL